MQKISIVIPVYNSEENLHELHKRLNEDVKFHELILVNDCSKDKSWSIIEELSLKDNRLKGIHLRKNSGQDNAILAGLGIVTGDVVIIMDDDLQHDPAYVKDLIKELNEKNLDVCFANFNVKKQKTWKNMGSYFNGRMASLLLNYDKNIYLSPFKAINGDLAREIGSMNIPRPYIDAMIVMLTGSLGMVDIPHKERFQGKSNYNLMRSLKVFSKMFFSFSYLPVRLIHLFGVFYFLLSLGLSTYNLYLWLKGDYLPEGWMTLLILQLISSTIMLMCLALVSEYIGRIFIKEHGQHPYSIKKRTNR